MRRHYPDAADRGGGEDGECEGDPPVLDWTGMGVLVGLENEKTAASPHAEVDPADSADAQSVETEIATTAHDNSTVSVARLPGTWEDCRLWFAAQIAQEIRRAVLDELGSVVCRLALPYALTELSL